MIRFNTFGTPVLERATGERRVHLCLQPKQLALLAYLCLEGSSRASRRDRIVYLLWPELDQDHARAALSQAVYRLRRHLGADTVLSFGQDELTIDRGRVWCDAFQLEECLASGRGEDALHLYGGDFLEGFHLAGAPDFERWLADRRERIREALVGAALGVAEGAEARGHLPKAVQVLRRALEVSPLEEFVVRRLLLLLDRTGEPGEALRVYDDFAARLGDEYDLAPAPETRDTVASMLARVRTAQEAGGDVPRPPIRSLAVLSFRALGEPSDGALFADGLPEEILNALGRMGGLKVIAGNSSFRFVSGDHDPREVGRRLDVDAVVEGSIQVEGRRARIHVRLVGAGDGALLWSRTYGRRRSTRDLFGAQEAVARAIANALRIELDPASSERLSWEPTDNLEAYSLCLRGRHAWSRRTPEALEEARRLFRRSLRHDPAYAAAWAGLADTLAMLPLYARVDPIESHREAREAASRAVELDEGSAEAHAARAGTLEAERRREESGREFRRALQLNPNYATARHWYANHLLRLGKTEEGLLEIERATRLDPLSPAVWIGHAFILYLLRRYEGAIQSAGEAMAMESAAEGAHLVLALAQAEGGDPRQAVETCSRFCREFPDAPRGPGALVYVLARAGRLERAQAVLRDAGSSGAEPLMLAAAQAALGDPDEALRYLANAEWDTINVDMLALSAAFDPLRADPRFRALRDRLGLVIQTEARSRRVNGIQHVNA